MTMSHTYAHLLVHVVFSTKGRAPLLTPELHPRLFPYLGGIVRELTGTALLINGTADHVHLLLRLPATCALADLLRTLKANSSRWIHEAFQNPERLAWQTGYGAFSVSVSNADRVLSYIRRQEQHHRRLSFQEEFVALLRRHGLTYDERQLWD
jgi:putative transposase